MKCYGCGNEFDELTFGAKDSPICSGECYEKYGDKPTFKPIEWKAKDVEFDLPCSAFCTLVPGSCTISMSDSWESPTQLERETPRLKVFAELNNLSWSLRQIKDKYIAVVKCNQEDEWERTATNEFAEFAVNSVIDQAKERMQIGEGMGSQKAVVPSEDRSRLKIIEVSREALTQLLLRYTDLPEGIEIMQVSSDVLTDTISFRLRHESFPVVLEGSCILSISPMVKP